ncbi:MAG: hypothetical protein PWQ22_995 [Archaeoglobaceae archaeon]|nr:hypothetical protein [Archaeoglobaceae archaeon]
MPFAIESALNQTEKPKEIIVVADEAEKVPYKDKVYVVEVKDEKLGPKILEGVKASSGELIALLDDDDLFHAKKIEKVKKLFENKEIVAVHNYQEFIDLKGGVVEENNPIVRYHKKNQPRFQVLLDKKNAFKFWKKYPGIHHNNSSLMVRKEIFEEYEEVLKKIDLAPDYAIFVLSLLDGKLLHTPEKLTYYRIGTGISQYERGDLQKAKGHFCTWNRYMEGHYLLYKFVDDPEIKKIAFNSFVNLILKCYIFEPYTDCNVKFQISYRDLGKYIISAWLSGNRTYLLPTIAFLLIPLIGRKRVARIAMWMIFGI